jgi:hypothetical protein
LDCRHECIITEIGAFNRTSGIGLHACMLDLFHRSFTSAFGNIVVHGRCDYQ